MKTIFLTLSLSLLSVSQNFAATIIHFDNSEFITQVGAVDRYDFDNFAQGAVLGGSEYAGITISARRLTVVNPQSFAPGLDVGGANLNTQPHGVSASLFYSSSDTISFDNLDDFIDITLASEKYSAGLWLGNLGAFVGDTSTQTRVTFLNNTNGIIADQVLTQGSSGIIGSGLNNRIFIGVVSDSAISRIEIRNNASDGDGIILDDIQVASIPEPSSVALVAVGLSAFVTTRRRTNRRG
jgi:hypothetical protein